jgi:hypothetical protein
MHSLRENSRCNAARENGAHSAEWGIACYRLRGGHAAVGSQVCAVRLFFFFFGKTKCNAAFGLCEFYKSCWCCCCSRWLRRPRHHDVIPALLRHRCPAAVFTSRRESAPICPSFVRHTRLLQTCCTPVSARRRESAPICPSFVRHTRLLQTCCTPVSARRRERCTMTLSSRALAWDLGDADRLKVVVSLRSCVCVKGELVPVRKRFVIVEGGK